MPHYTPFRSTTGVQMDDAQATFPTTRYKTYLRLSYGSKKLSDEKHSPGADARNWIGGVRGGLGPRMEGYCAAGVGRQRVVGAQGYGNERTSGEDGDTVPAGKYRLKCEVASGGQEFDALPPAQIVRPGYGLVSWQGLHLVFEEAQGKYQYYDSRR
ncbi:hypothetical protein P692DRAFT_201808288 [Suillus brevipes Sb2]|nr:hypothetical protein P692DRAFT_201808288 [Suillus brevipes Sb2]